MFYKPSGAGSWPSPTLSSSLLSLVLAPFQKLVDIIFLHLLVVREGILVRIHRSLAPAHGWFSFM